MKICPTCSSRYPDNVQFCPEDGAELVAISDNSAGPEDSDDLTGKSIFGDYVIRKKLGEGGMGSVYLAENREIDHRLAIKVLHTREANDELIKRFNREAKATARLTHPNIIRVLVFGRSETGLMYLAMEFVEGKPLRDVLFHAGHFDELRSIAIMRQALHALAEAHELGIVHRDLKPDNIMLTNFRGVDDYVKILDFGIAKVKEPDGKPNQKLTQAGVVYGTPEYLSPEQAMAKELDGRSDLYSMGVILYEMVTGAIPFESPTAVGILAAHVYNQPKPPIERAMHKVHPEMNKIILRAMEKDPNKRYQSSMEFLSDLEALEAQLKGGKATRTTMLDPRELSLVMEASRAYAAQKGQPAAQAAQPAPAPAPAAPAAAQPTPAPAQVAQAPARVAPTQIEPAADKKIVLLYGLIGVLGLVLLVLVIVLLTRSSGANAMEWGTLLLEATSDPGSLPASAN